MDAGVGEALVDVGLTVQPAEAEGTPATVAGRKLLAVASVLARPISAVIDRAIAKTSGPSLETVALERVDSVDAAAVLARVVVAVVDVVLAMPAVEPEWAVADVRPERVPARAAVEARVVLSAVVLLDLAVLSGKPDGADAAVVVDEVGAHATVLAGPRPAFVDVCFAVGAVETWKRRSNCNRCINSFL